MKIQNISVISGTSGTDSMLIFIPASAKVCQFYSSLVLPDEKMDRVIWNSGPNSYQNYRVNLIDYATLSVPRFHDFEDLVKPI